MESDHRPVQSLASNGDTMNGVEVITCMILIYYAIGERLDYTLFKPWDKV
jgi:hypothetical protein